LDELGLEVGYALVPLVDVQQGGQLLARVKALRTNLAQQLEFIVLPVHITDNARLKPREYVISLRGVEIARWEMRDDNLLAISSGVSPPPPAGTSTREPAFGVSALWIAPALQNQALGAGYAVVDQTSELATHLAEVIKQHASELLTRHETKRLLDRLAETHPKLVEELVPKLLSLGEVQKVLQQLLREKVSIRDLAGILETLLDTAVVNKNLVPSAPGSGTRAGEAVAGRGWRPARGHARQQYRGRAQPHIHPAKRGRGPRGSSAFAGPPSAGGPAPSGGGTGVGHQPSAPVFHPGTFSSEAAARSLHAQAGGVVAGRDSAGDFGAVGGSAAMKRGAPGGGQG